MMNKKSSLKTIGSNLDLNKGIIQLVVPERKKYTPSNYLYSENAKSRGYKSFGGAVRSKNGSG